MQSASTRKRRYSFVAGVTPEATATAAATATHTNQSARDVLRATLRGIWIGELDASIRSSEHARQEQLEAKQRQIVLNTRSDHLLLLDELGRLGIDSQLPIVVILASLSTSRIGNTPILRRFATQWAEYKRRLYGRVQDIIARTASESANYFDRFMGSITFKNVFKNSMWNDGDMDLDVYRDLFTTFETDPERQQHAEILKRQAVSRRMTQSEHREHKEHKTDPDMEYGEAEVDGYVGAAVEYADSRARADVASWFASHTLPMRLVVNGHRVSDFLDAMTTDLGTMLLFDSDDNVDAVGALRMQCTALRDTWNDMVADEKQQLTHADVRQFLTSVETQVNQIETEHQKAFAEVNYDTDYSTWLDLQTTTHRVQCMRNALQDLAEQTAAVARQSSVITDWLDAAAAAAVSATETGAKKKKKARTAEEEEDKSKSPTEQDTESNLENLTKYLKEQFDDFNAKLSSLHDSFVDESKDGAVFKEQLDKKRSDLLTAALHLDFVAWVRSVLQAVGSAFLMAEDTPGQLAQRVQLAFAAPGNTDAALAHAHIDTVLERDKKTRHNRTVALMPDLEARKAFMQKEIKGRFVLVQKHYTEQAHAFESQVDTTIHTLHPQWLTWPVNRTQGRTNLSPVALLVQEFNQSRWAGITTPDTQAPAAARETLEAHNVDNWRDLTHMESLARKLNRTAVALMCVELTASKS